MRLMHGNLDRDIFAPSIRLRTREDLGYGDESLFAPEIVRVRSDDHRYRRAVRGNAMQVLNLNQVKERRRRREQPGVSIC